MERIESVIEEIERMRSSAVERFAAEANMPVPDFRRHFRVVLEEAKLSDGQVSFRVEPKEAQRKRSNPPLHGV